MTKLMQGLCEVLGDALDRELSSGDGGASVRLVAEGILNLVYHNYPLPEDWVLRPLSPYCGRYRYRLTNKRDNYSLISDMEPKMLEHAWKEKGG